MQAFQLKNGIRVQLIPQKGTKAVTVLVLVKVGSRYEYKEINGASHFIEHMMFKGTKKRPSPMDISKSLDAMGAEYNAYTGKDLTGYYIKSASEHVNTSIEMLYDMLFNSVYEPAAMNRERKVIIEEINMYEDNPMMFAGDLLERALFDGSSLGWEIAGTRDNMLEMTRKNVLAFRDAAYSPERMVVTLAGNITNDIKKHLESTFGKIKASKESVDYDSLSADQIKSGISTRIQKKEVEQVQIAFGFPSVSIGHKDDLAAKLLATVLGGFMSSRLFTEVREKKGLAYFVRASQHGYEDIGAFTIQSGLDKSRLPLAAKTIWKELDSIKKKGITAEELRRAKDFVHGKMLLSLEDSSNVAEFYARQELYLESVESPEKRMEALKRVNAKQIQALANRLFDTSKMAVAAIGPYTRSTLLKETQLI